jgi:hypothetical protein
MNYYLIVAVSGLLFFASIATVAYQLGKVVGRAAAFHDAIHERVTDVRDGRL